MQAIDPSGLAAEDLRDHLNACRDFLVFAVTNHHRLNPTNMVPLGDFLSHAEVWTGLDPADLLQLMQGASPHSGGAVDELAALAAALRDDAGTLDLLRSDDQVPDEIIDQLRTDDGAVGDAARALIGLIGYRIMSGYDVADLYTLEAPATLVQVIRTAVDGDPAGGAVDAGAKAAAVRELVPERHRAAFDELYEEARSTYHLRDEKIFCGDSLATGLTRRALQAIGRALADANKLDDPSHVFDATHDELIALLDSGNGPAASEFAERTRRRTEATVAGPADVPPFLGGPPSPPPPADWLPAKAARMQRAADAVLGHMFRHDESPPEGKMLRGLSASPGTHEGIARVVKGPADFHRVAPGDILVAQTTAPAYNVLLPMLGAVVTARGGVLSHAAVVAREYGLPAVVGCGAAMTEIADGTRVRVDGDEGAVWIEI